MGYTGFVFIILFLKHLYFKPDFFNDMESLDTMLWFHQLWFYQFMFTIMFVADTFYNKINK